MLLSKTKNRNLIHHLKHIYESNQARKQELVRQTEFIHELRLAQSDLEAARNNYNYTQDSNLIEYYIYEIKAAETRLNYYLQRAKKERLYNDPWVMYCKTACSREEGTL